MKAFLLFPDRDLDPETPAPPGADDLVQDLELPSLFGAMARDDRFIREVVSAVVLASLTDADTIAYRQQALRDCLARPSAVRELYTTVTDTIEGARKRHFGLYPGASPGSILYASVNMLGFLVERLLALRGLGRREAAGFASPAFTRLFAMLDAELDDAYFHEIADQLAYLRFRGGVLNSAELGPGNKGVRYVLRRSTDPTGWLRRIADWRRSSGSSFVVDPRDEAGARTLAEIRGRGLNTTANALAQSTDHILSFFGALRTELAFYVGCLNLHEHLATRNQPTCLPTPVPAGEPAMTARGLYDVCLTLHLDGTVVGNDLEADGPSLVVITGANQGGKSTLLRSIGLAQVMMQCGMFVGAQAFRTDVRDGVFTHYKREEDPSMRSGKLDEELQRMSAIVDAIGPGSLLLCNESFASTNEREGSEIAGQVVRALVEAGVKVLFVTHLFDLADTLRREEADRALFLRAERLPDGSRTFRVVPGEPLPTSHGRDLYERIFATT